MKNGEETLDPSDWTEARALAHRMVEDAVQCPFYMDGYCGWHR